MSNKPIGIGSVGVIRGEPENGNPFRASDKMRRLSAVEREELTADDVDTMQGVSVMGPERILALRSFRDTGAAEGYTFWNITLGTPPHPTRRIETPEGINWSTSSLDDYDKHGRYPS